MKAITDILSVIFMIALIIIVAPQILEIAAFLFIIFLQLVVGYMVASFIFSIVSSALNTEEEGQKAWTF